jgi:hypothetical protein
MSEETIICYEDPNLHKSLGDLQNNTKTYTRSGTKSFARDNCGEGQPAFYQVSSKTIWKRFPVKVYIDESRYPGVESKAQARAAIKRVLTQTNEELGFTFYTVLTDRSQCNLFIEFGPLSSGIGLSHYRYRDRGSGNETYESTVTLNTNTSWFINPVEQCFGSGRKMHMPCTIAHELGHSFGLNHNSTDNKATMRSFGNTGETLRETYGLSEKTFLHQFYDRFKPATPPAPIPIPPPPVPFTCVMKITTTGKRWYCTSGSRSWYAGEAYRYNGKLASEISGFICVVKSTTAGKRWECTNGTSTWFAGPDYRYNGQLASQVPSSPPQSTGSFDNKTFQPDISWG